MAELFWPGQDVAAAVLTLPACRLVYDATQANAGELGADLVLSLADAGRRNLKRPDFQAAGSLSGDILGHLVACLDRGGVVAIHAACDPDIDQAVGEILGWTGGGRA